MNELKQYEWNHISSLNLYTWHLNDFYLYNPLTTENTVISWNRQGFGMSPPSPNRNWHYITSKPKGTLLAWVLYSEVCLITEAPYLLSLWTADEISCLPSGYDGYRSIKQIRADSQLKINVQSAVLCTAGFWTIKLGQMVSRSLTIFKYNKNSKKRKWKWGWRKRRKIILSLPTPTVYEHMKKCLRDGVNRNSEQIITSCISKQLPSGAEKGTTEFEQ